MVGAGWHGGRDRKRGEGQRGQRENWEREAAAEKDVSLLEVFKV